MTSLLSFSYQEKNALVLGCYLNFGWAAPVLEGCMDIPDSKHPEKPKVSDNTEKAINTPVCLYSTTITNQDTQLHVRV